MSPVQLFWRNSPLTVHHKAQLLRIGHLVGSRQPWAHRREGVGAFPLGPLAAHFFLEGPLRKIAERRISRHMVERLALVHVGRGAADHHRQFHLVVELLGAARE
jgi:hypothetical protein